MAQGDGCPANGVGHGVAHRADEINAHRAATHEAKIEQTAAEGTATGGRKAHDTRRDARLESGQPSGIGLGTATHLVVRHRLHVERRVGRRRQGEAFAFVHEGEALRRHVGDEEHGVLRQSEVGDEGEEGAVVVLHMRHAPPAAGTERTVVVATVGHLQRARGDGIAVWIERRVAQQRDDTLLLGVADAVLHAVGALVPLRRCVARMLG